MQVESNERRKERREAFETCECSCTPCGVLRLGSAPRTGVVVTGRFFAPNNKGEIKGRLRCDNQERKKTSVCKKRATAENSTALNNGAGSHLHRLFVTPSSPFNGDADEKGTAIRPIPFVQC